MISEVDASDNLIQSLLLFEQDVFNSTERVFVSSASKISATLTPFDSFAKTVRYSTKLKIYGGELVRVKSGEITLSRTNSKLSFNGSW